MDKSQLINKWLNELDLRESNCKERLRLMLNTLNEIELMKPFLLADRAKGKSYRELSIKYGISFSSVRYTLDCAKKQHGTFLKNLE